MSQRTPRPPALDFAVDSVVDAVARLVSCLGPTEPTLKSWGGGAVIARRSLAQGV
jgi:hypothetical protein